MGGKQSLPVVSLSRDRVIIVTGGNSGIGYHTAKWLAMMGATVIIACRSETKATQAIQSMNKEFQEEKRKGTSGLAQYDQLSVEFMKLDCASLVSVQKFIDDFKASGRQLHVLLCNAGKNSVRKTITEDGNELLFQVNYLSHFLMAVNLLPVMRTSGEDCRMIFMCSLWYKSGRFNLNEINAEQENKETYDSDYYYQKSKLYMVMLMYKMNRILNETNVTVTCVDPGICRTNMMADFQEQASSFERTAIGCINVMGVSTSADEGARCSINAAVNPELRGKRDVYLKNSKPETVKSHARVEADQESLWLYSLDRVREHLPDDALTTDIMIGLPQSET